MPPGGVITGGDIIITRNNINTNNSINITVINFNNNIVDNNINTDEMGPFGPVGCTCSVAAGAVLLLRSSSSCTTGCSSTATSGTSTTSTFTSSDSTSNASTRFTSNGSKFTTNSSE